MIAKIAVSAAVYAIDKPYDYRVPPNLKLLPGQRVAVPFGRSNKRCEGVVLALGEGEEDSLKPVVEWLDPEPLLDERALRLAAFLRERYFCTFYEAIKAILPAGVWFRERERYEIRAENWRATVCQPVQASVMQTVEALGGAADYEVLRRSFDEAPLQSALRSLVRKKFLSCTTEHRRRLGDKTERIATLAASPEEALQYAATKKHSAPLQGAVLELLATVGRCACKELCYFTGATGQTINRLEKLGYLTLSEQEVLRVESPAAAPAPSELTLNGEQEAAYRGLHKQMLAPKPGVALLYGVTGSGKTSVYLKLIADCLTMGRGAVVLVPEISLTPQLLAIFAAHFGEQVAVLHSSLRLTQRYDTWKRIRSGEARVVLGTRSAVFAPVRELGLLILDEEQEHSYQSENAPRYHAREVAIYRAAQVGALALLGSATPCVETMYRAESGVYSLYTLKKRYNSAALPPVEIVDMKRELKSGNATAISEPLLMALRENLAQGRQSILFLNRRGTSRMIACVDCGYVPQCPACTVNLTYHEANGRLMCHYCGHSELLPHRCPACGGHLKQIGFGTQKVEQQLHTLLPGTQVLRMDADTVSTTNPHEKILARFRDERVPILLGTQMVAKGLDFENVTLVGVLDADMALYVPSYRAAETAFTMITQVIGRAGRGALPGRAAVQTMTPDNAVLRLAAAQDYDGFYRAELPLRELRGCPPYADLLRLTFHGRIEEAVWQAAGRFRDALRAQLVSDYYRVEQARLLGPAPAQIARINYNYRCRLTLSCRNTRPLRQLVAFLIREFLKDRQNAGVGVFVDVNSEE